MKADEERLPDLVLEQYALGELPASERSSVDARLASDSSLRRRLEELRRSNEDILSQSPSAEIAAAIRRRMLVGAASAGGVKYYAMDNEPERRGHDQLRSERDRQTLRHACASVVRASSERPRRISTAACECIARAAADRLLKR